MKESLSEVITAFTVTLAFFVALFNVAKIILMPKKRKIKEMAASFFVGWPFGFLAGWIAVDLGAGEKVSIGIACFVVLIAEKIAVFFMTADYKKYFDLIATNLINRWTK